MKKTCALILCLMLLAAAPAAKAQQFVPAAVEISNSKVRIDGKVYYEHKVKEKQTLYSICKAYGVDLQEVSKINADQLENGLKVGALLLIPTGGVPDEKESQAQAQPKAKPDVKQEYNSGKSEPELSGAEKAHAAAVQQGEVRYIRHRVKWYDSMLMLSLKYKVSQEDIIAANNLDSRTLVVGQILKIPVSDFSEIDDNEMIEITEEETFEAEDGTGNSDTITITDWVEPEEEEPAIVPFNGTARIALVLPIASRTNSPSGNFLDFYAGILMALNEIKSSGISIYLKVIDMADYDSCLQLVEKAGLDKFDFVIGNFSVENIEVVADYCDAHRVPLISPMDQKIEEVAYYHKYLINVPLSSSTQTMRLAESIQYRPSKDNVIVWGENGETRGTFHKEITHCLDSLGIPYSTVGGGISRNGGSGVRENLVSGKRNHVIITSERETVAADAVRNTGMIARGGQYDITGYTSHKARRFESIDQELFQRMNARFCLGYYVDYTDEATRDFVRRYRALYNIEPGPFGFQGYDIANYFVKALSKYGSDMINGIGNMPGSGLQLNFRFDRRTEEGGMFNEASRNIDYEDGGITLRR